MSLVWFDYFLQKTNAALNVADVKNLASEEMVLIYFEF